MSPVKETENKTEIKEINTFIFFINFVFKKTAKIFANIATRKPLSFFLRNKNAK